jgi:hypothetical protein
LSPEIYDQLWKPNGTAQQPKFTAVNCAGQSNPAKSRSKAKGYIFYQIPIRADKRKNQPFFCDFPGEIHKIFHRHGPRRGKAKAPVAGAFVSR